MCVCVELCLLFLLHVHLHRYEGVEVPDDENRCTSWFSFALFSIYLLLGNFDTWHIGN